MCITGYFVMDNSIHSIWKSERVVFPSPFFIFFMNSYISFRVLHYHLQSVNINVHPQNVKIKGGQYGTANF